MSEPLTGCRWPIAGNDDAFVFCGEAATGPYCPTHTAISLGPADRIDAAVQRGLITAARLERLRTEMMQAMTGIMFIAGRDGLDASVAGALILVKASAKPASGEDPR